MPHLTAPLHPMTMNGGSIVAAVAVSALLLLLLLFRAIFIATDPPYNAIGTCAECVRASSSSAVPMLHQSTTRCFSLNDLAKETR